MMSKELNLCKCGAKVEIASRNSCDYKIWCIGERKLFRRDYRTKSEAIEGWNASRFCQKPEPKDPLKAFARKVIEAKVWTYTELDGLDVQDLALELKLLEPFTVTEADVTEKSDLGVGDTGYTFSDILKEKE